jgi:hypothetical protein
MALVAEPAEGSKADRCLSKFGIGHVKEIESFNQAYDSRDEGPTEEYV